VALAETLAPRPAHAVMEATARLIARRVHVTGLGHIPATGGR
jgi:hypothetical protein